MFARADGWGTNQVGGESTAGVVEVMVWCNFLVPTVFDGRVTVGPGVTDEQLEIPFPQEIESVDDLFLSVLVSVTSTNTTF